MLGAAPHRSVALACCLGLILQLPGIATAILACGCILPGRTCCCSSLSDSLTSGCCEAARQASPPDCCSNPKGHGVENSPKDSSDSSCPCWQALTERFAALPSSPRFHHDSDTAVVALDVAKIDVDPVAFGRQRTAASSVPVEPRLRLQSLLCVWII